MKIKTLLYCTKAKPILVKNVDGTYTTTPNLLPFDTPLNGKIACECEVDTEELTYAPNPTPFDRANFSPREWLYDYQGKDYLTHEELLKCSCLTDNELSDYLNTPTNDKKTFCKDTFGYALHLSNVKERVMELSRCYSQSQVDNLNIEEYFYQIKGIEKAPQNMQWVYILNHEDKLEKRLLISVRPQYLCKILNGEKDIEVRRKVLKGMCE